MGDTMYDRYGLLKVTLMVSSFYKAVLESPQLAGYFEDTHIAGLVDHQAAFMAAVMGAPPSHGREDLRVAHEHLRISDEDFDEMIRLLRSTLEKHDLGPDDVDDVCNRYLDMRPAIVV